MDTYVSETDKWRRPDGSLVGVDISDIATDFDGVALDNGWTFVASANGGAGTLTMDGHATLELPAGTTYDSISSVGGTDNTIGLVHDISGDFDIAVRIASIIEGDSSSMIGFVFRGSSDAEMVRWTPYASNKGLSEFGYVRTGGAGSIFSNQTRADHELGAWMRAQRIGNDWFFYLSTDGYNWTIAGSPEATLNTAMQPETVKLVLGQYSQNLGLPFSYDKVVDLLARGNDDARDLAPPYDVGTLVSTDFSTAPAWLTLETTVDGAAAVTGGVLELKDGAGDNSSGKAYGTTGYPYAGVKVKTQWTEFDGLSYAVVGLGIDDGVGSDIDVYSKGPGYVFEMRGSGTQGTRFIRIHRPIATTDFEEPYVFLVDVAQAPIISASAEVWIRIERFEERIRFKVWDDIDPEPIAWYWDAEETTLTGDLVPYFAIGHNPGGSITGTPTVTFDDLEFYELTTPV